MGNIWFIADTHFGHAGIMRIQSRPWHVVDDMDRDMITKWNKVVGPNDHVYHLGDVSLHKDKSKTTAILHSLNGDITVVTGNHDSPSLLRRTGRFKAIIDYPILFDKFFLLSHKPLFIGDECLYMNIHG